MVKYTRNVFEKLSRRNDGFARNMQDNALGEASGHVRKKEKWQLKCGRDRKPSTSGCDMQPTCSWSTLTAHCRIIPFTLRTQTWRGRSCTNFKAWSFQGSSMGFQILFPLLSELWSRILLREQGYRLTNMDRFCRVEPVQNTMVFSLLKKNGFFAASLFRFHSSRHTIITVPGARASISMTLSQLKKHHYSLKSFARLPRLTAPDDKKTC